MRRNAKEDRKKRFIRLDSYFEKLRVKDRHINIRRQFGIPGQGCNNEELYNWEEKFFEDKNNVKEWQTMLISTADSIGLPLEYIDNLEIFLTTNNIGSYPIDQPGIPNTRREDSYLRNKKLMELYTSINPATGKKFTAEEVAEAYQPDPNKMSPSAFDKWQDKIGVGSGEAIRKIVSRHKKNHSK